MGGASLLLNSLLSRSFLRTPGVRAEAALLLALRLLEADSLLVECRDSASSSPTNPPTLPALMVSRLHRTCTEEARLMTEGSGVGRARRGGGRGPGVTAGVGEHGGEGGREGLEGGGEEPGWVREGSTGLKVLESQDSLTNRVSSPLGGGKGSASARCLTW